jgi:ribonuclease P protein component
VRRRLREIIRQDQEQLTPGIHLVIIARWRSAEASLDDLRADWRRLARRAGILHS